MQPVLIDGSELTAQPAVKIINHLGIALHDVILASGSTRTVFRDAGAAIIVAARFACLFDKMCDGACATPTLRRFAQRSKHVSHTIWGAGSVQAIPNLLFTDHIAGADNHNNLKLCPCA
jgi:hypothetical protein